MESKIKDFLYAWLGRQKLQPSYSASSINRGGITRFKCEVRVPGHSYVGLGNSQNKKDAATNAAMDFCQYLVRQGLIKESEIPQLTPGSLEATSTVPGSMFGSAGPDATSGDGVPAKIAKFEPNLPNFTSHDKYVAMKAEEVSQNESVDFRSDLHGGWTMENSKSALNEWAQKSRLPVPTYRMKQTEGGTVSTFVSEATIFVPVLKKSIHGRGQGSNKKVAEGQCAVSIVRQLFHLGQINAFGGQRKKKDATNLPEICVPTDEGLMNRVREYVQTMGVSPSALTEEECTPENPRSLLVDCKLAVFPDSEPMPSANISWCPPQQNWNAWRASNIDTPPLAFMTLKDVSSELTTREANRALNQEILTKRQELPVFQYKQQLIDTIQGNSVTLIKGETGCGKSTQVAQFLLEYYVAAGRGAEFAAFVSQPRRISAISLAERVAAERGEEIGESVGYGVRFEGVSPRPYGSIMFCTVGVLLRKMESGLRGISHVIIDEIHERDINTDFVLVVLREMIREYRDLRIVLMSATIDTKMFQQFFDNCPIIEMHGRTFPVRQFFMEDILSDLQFMPPMPEKRRETEEFLDETKNLNLAVPPETSPQVKMALNRLNEKEIPFSVIEAILLDIDKQGQDGSILLFMPGWNEIQAVLNHLKTNPIFGNPQRYVLLPLHSQLTGAEQRKVFDHYGSARKIIASTNIAETSVTIDDVVYVIDSCRAKEKMYTSHNNMVHFATVWASRTNLAQRKGRAGRVREGFAFVLCTKARYNALEEHRTAEMLRTPLHEIALTIKLLRLGSIGEFLSKAIEPPPVDAVIESEVLLKEMGALDKNHELTDLGRIIARMPIDPIIGKTIVMATALGIGALMCDVAAASSFSCPFIPAEKFHTRLSGGQRAFAGRRWSDHVAAVAVNQRYREAIEMSVGGENVFCQRYSLSQTILKMTTGAKSQLVDVLVSQCGFPEDIMYDKPVDVHGQDPELDLLTSLLVMGLYPNICFYSGKRKVYTLEQASALLSKQSVMVPFKGDEYEFPSPLLVFTEKVRTRVIACKELTVVSPVQVLIFGSRKVECVGKDLVKLDDMVTVRMPVADAAALVALRPCIDALLVHACTNPDSMNVLSEEDRNLSEILRELSSEKFMATPSPLKDAILSDVAQSVLNNRGRGAPRGYGRGRGRGAPSYNDGFNGGFTQGGGNRGRGFGGPRGGARGTGTTPFAPYVPSFAAGTPPGIGNGLSADKSDSGAGAPAPLMPPSGDGPPPGYGGPEAAAWASEAAGYGGGPGYTGGQGGYDEHGGCGGDAGYNGGGASYGYGGGQGGYGEHSSGPDYGRDSAYSGGYQMGGGRPRGRPGGFRPYPPRGGQGYRRGNGFGRGRTRRSGVW